MTFTFHDSNWVLPNSVTDKNRRTDSQRTKILCELNPTSAHYLNMLKNGQREWYDLFQDFISQLQLQIALSHK